MEKKKSLLILTDLEINISICSNYTGNKNVVFENGKSSGGGKNST